MLAIKLTPNNAPNTTPILISKKPSTPLMITNINGRINKDET